MIVCATTLTSLLIGAKAFLPGRQFPTAPLLATIPDPPGWSLWVGYIAILTLTVGVAILRQPKAAATALAALVIGFAIFDQTRWQPWLFEFIFVLLVLSSGPRDSEERVDRALNLARLILICVYFYSGAQKLNMHFVDWLAPEIMKPFIGDSDIGRALVRAGAFAAPFVEMGIGILLFLPRTRKVGVLGALGLHLMLLIVLGPLGNNYNPIVWPWNIGSAAVIVVLFWGASDNILPHVAGRLATWPARAVFVLFAVMPALGLFGWWDAYMSFSLYSGASKQAAIAVRDSEVFKLPEEAVRYAKSSRGACVVSLVQWSIIELGMPVYPETRVYKQIAEKLCPEGGSDYPFQLLIRELPDRVSGKVPQTTIECCVR